MKKKIICTFKGFNTKLNRENIFWRTSDAGYQHDLIFLKIV